MTQRINRLVSRLAQLVALAASLAGNAAAAADRPNILVIMGDDIGMFNISAYHRGLVGGTTPNIDRIANEGTMFMDYYAEQSCTAGRAAFITGQHPFRTGLLTVGLPGAKIGLSSDDPTLAELLKPLGYVTGQFGKNHLGDRDEYLPHNHGFDEFFGNLYHLNAEEEPEDFDYPKDPEFRRQYGPRGVLDCKAGSGCRDTGPLTRERMETADDEFIDRSLEFIDRAVKDGKPFFVWANTTRMHVWTRLEPKWQGKSGYGLYADGMMEHDEDVGRLLHKLDELKIADNTIVIYTSDNGAQTFTYPDGGVIPFRGYKGTTWEGGFRVPALVRWPGHIKAGRIETGIWSHQDWLPTLVAVAGVPGIKEKLLNGYAAGGKTYKVHLDGYDQLGNLLGKEPSRREEIYYFSDKSTLNAVRWKDWKVHFREMNDWVRGGESKGWPMVVNLKSDPFERALDESAMYLRWYGDKLWLFVPVQHLVAKFAASFQAYPVRQRSASFDIDPIMEQLQRASSGSN